MTNMKRIFSVYTKHAIEFIRHGIRNMTIGHAKGRVLVQIRDSIRFLPVHQGIKIPTLLVDGKVRERVQLSRNPWIRHDIRRR